MASCPRCTTAVKVGIKASTDAKFTIRDYKYTCPKCYCVVRVPDARICNTNIDNLPVDMARVADDFEEIIRKSLVKDRLATMYTIFSQAANANAAQQHQLIKITNSLFDQGSERAINQPIHTYMGLFLIQMHLESRQFYTTWRNLLNPLVNRCVCNFPWSKSPPSEYRITDTKNNFVVLNRNVIIKNICSDLNSIDYPELSRELSHTNSNLANLIRNAVAHSTFTAPETDEDIWTFSEYCVEDGKRQVRQIDHVVSHHEFSNYIRRVFAFRVAASQALAKIKGELSIPIEFESRNQRKPDQMLKCRFDGTKLEWEHTDTPPFDGGCDDASTRDVN